MRPVCVRRFSAPLPVSQCKDALVSPEGRLLALRSHDGALQLYSLAYDGFLSGFQSAQVLHYVFACPEGAGRTFLLAVNSKGTLLLYEHRGRTRARFNNVRVVLRVTNESPLDPVLVRLENDALLPTTLEAASPAEGGGDEDDETVFCWAVDLERLGAFVSKKEKLLAVVAMAVMAEGRHVVLLVRSKTAHFVVVLDMTGHSLALRRWWSAPDDVVAMDAANGVVVCLGKDALHAYTLDGAHCAQQPFALPFRPRSLRLSHTARWAALDHTVVALQPLLPAGAEEGTPPPGLCDLGPRSLGMADADYPYRSEAAAAPLRRPWLEPNQQQPAPTDTGTASVVPPSVPSMLSVPCDGGQRWLLVAADGIYVPGIDLEACIRATLVFEGPQAAFAVARANASDVLAVRLLTLKLALEFGNVDGARAALQELPLALRTQAREMAASCKLEWPMLREWASACVSWAENDSDQEAAAAVRSARIAVWDAAAAAAAAAAGVAPTSIAAPASTASDVAREDSFKAKRSLFGLGSPGAASPAKAATPPPVQTWKPSKAMRKAWDGFSEEEIVRRACLSGRIAEAVAFLTWRASSSSNAASVAPSIMGLACEAAYRALCRSEVEDATCMLANTGSLDVQPVLAEAFLHSVRPSVRNALHSRVSDLVAPELLAMANKLFATHAGVCMTADVDDHPQAWKWHAEEPAAEGGGTPALMLRASLAWIQRWGREGVQDVLIDAAVMTGAPVPPNPEWDPLGERVLSYYCRHGDERAARKWCANVGPAHLDAVRRALESGAAPHVQRAVLVECARHGLHPLGHNVQIACAAGAMLQQPETGRACVAHAVEAKRASLLHTLLDAGAPLVEEDFPQSNEWAALALAVRKGDILQMSARTVKLLHGLHMGRPLIGIAHALYAGEEPNAAHLQAIGCPDVWHEAEPQYAPFVLDDAAAALMRDHAGAYASSDALQRADEQFAHPTRREWLVRERPFRAFLEPASSEQEEAALMADDATITPEARTALLWLQGRPNESRFRAPSVPKSSWLAELLEASLDGERGVLPECGSLVVDALRLREVCSDPWSEFVHRWSTLRLRSAHDLVPLPASAVNVDEAQALLDRCLEDGAAGAWEATHLLRTLSRAAPFTLMHENWLLIMEHSLNPSLLRASRQAMGEELRTLGLWDAARRHDPERASVTTLAQADRLVPKWHRIASLFEAEKLSVAEQSAFWMRHAATHDDIASLEWARRVSPELEVRHLLVEGGCPWPRFASAKRAGDAVAPLVQSAAGRLAALDGGSLQRAEKLCRLLDVTCAALEEAKLATASEGELTNFSLRYVSDAGWSQWTQGELLRIRAGSTAAESPDVVAAQLAANGQLTLAREWVIHFRPDTTQVSKMLGARYADALRKHYPQHIALAEAVSLASPSSRNVNASNVLDVGMADTQWESYVSVGGAPRIVGDVLVEALNRERQLVCAVELCVRAYTCYTMACYVQGMSRVLSLAITLANSLIEQQSFHHLVRLVTGVGNYAKLDFCFGALLDAEQFELILRKNPMMTASSRMDLRMSLHRYLRKTRPDDERNMSLLLLSFNMYREIGESLEQEATALLGSDPSTASRRVLLEAMSRFLDASDAFHKDRCLQASERCLDRARAVRLLIRRPAELSFGDAAVRARGTGQGPMWWIAALKERTLLGGSVDFFREAVVDLALPLADVYRGLIDAWRSLSVAQQTSTKPVLVTCIRDSRDIFLAFDLCMELSLDQLAEELSTNPAIRAFKLLRRVKE